MLVCLLLITAPFGDLIAQEKPLQTINAPEATKRELLPLRYNHPGLVVDLMETLT